MILTPLNINCTDFTHYSKPQYITIKSCSNVIGTEQQKYRAQYLVGLAVDGKFRHGITSTLSGDQSWTTEEMKR